MRWLILSVLLVGCGAGGEPITPTGGVGVTLGSGGASVDANVGVQSGPVSVSVGF